jgi:hypothetical protein
MPTAKDLHIDAALTNISIGYRNQTYIADEIFPLVPVQKRTDIIPKFPQSHWFRNAAMKRVSGTKSLRGGFTVDTADKYRCDRYSYGYEIDDEQRANADSIFQLDRLATDFATDKVQMAREIRFATDMMAVSIWGTDRTGAAAASSTQFIYWSTYATSSPLLDVATYKDTVEGKIAREPNVLVLGKQVVLQLLYHPDCLDAIKYTQTGIVSTDLLKSLLGFDKLLIGRCLYTTTVEVTSSNAQSMGEYDYSGAGTEQETLISYTRLWGKNGLMIYVPPNPSIFTPAAGYTFVWQRVPSAIQYVVRYRDDERETDIIECNSYFDHVITAANAGLFLSGAVA